MALVIECLQCHTKFEASDDALEKRGKCPKWQGAVRVSATQPWET